MIKLEPIYNTNEKIKGKLITLMQNTSIEKLRKEKECIVVIRNFGLPLIPFLRNIKAILFCEGSKYSSHASIIAREFEIPVYHYSEEKLRDIKMLDGKLVIINERGTLVPIDS